MKKDESGMHYAPPNRACDHNPRQILTAAVVVFAMAFVLRIALVLLLPNFDVPAQGEMENVAAEWARTGQLANPYSTPTGPTAHLAPVYPLLLGLIYRLFGTGANGHFVQAIFGCALSAARCALILPTALLLGLNRRTGLIAAGVSIGYISAFNTEVRGSWEAPLAALFLMLLVVLAVRFAEKRVFKLTNAAAYGIYAGTGVLISPVLILPMAAFLLATVPLGLRRWKRYVLWLALLAASAFLVVLPWLIRNQRVLGSAVIRSNFGLELSLAYNDQEQASALGNVLESHPLKNRAVSEHIAQVGEIAFNRERENQALNWIREHPGSAARLFVKHVIFFWFPPAENAFFRVFMAVVTVTALLGFLLLASNNQFAAWLIGLIWISFPTLYYVTYWSSRYRYPMDWTLLLCSAVLLEALGTRFRPREAETI